MLCLLGIAAGLVLLNTAGDDYKSTPTQCLLNVGPATPLLANIHSVLVSTSCCGTCMVFFGFFLDFINIYIHSTHNIQYRKKRRQDVRHDKKNRTKTKIWYINVTCFYEVIIWLDNKNWKKRLKKISNIIFTIIWKFKIYIYSSSDHPANERHKPNADSMSVHWLRRRHSTKSTLGQCVVSTEQ